MSYALILKRDRRGGHAPGPHDHDGLENMRPALRRLDGLLRATLCISEPLADPLLNERTHAGACLALYFRTHHDLTQACANAAALNALFLSEPFRGCDPGELSHQVMQAHCFSTSDGTMGGIQGGFGYMVGYEGDPTDPAAWVADYMENHVSLMQRLPGIRHIEVFTRIEPYVIPSMGLGQNWMLRNMACFATRREMAAALRSPARAALLAHRSGMAEHGGESEHISVSFQTMEVEATANDP
ncbi:MAG TPA: hypothetical protein VNT00_10900 [Eoetvoesiella sp.]|uniref:hypothetical protein n=1 Tax=Eoetvoesiella sp. TaxID=1966355 RepID=UPI002BEA07E1|nr:hypothetical protein [Eoetvoesiella sp.]HWK61920.1 hypothetical protein [Eoetvoesiella sp.]